MRIRKSADSDVASLSQSHVLFYDGQNLPLGFHIYDLIRISLVFFCNIIYYFMHLSASSYSKVSVIKMS